MPEVRFRIRWPDGAEETCYSPSTVIHDFLTTNEAYSVDEFHQRVRQALDRAALRVQAKYGFRCSSADAEAARLSLAVTRYKSEETVTCLSMT